MLEWKDDVHPGRVKVLRYWGVRLSPLSYFLSKPLSGLSNKSEMSKLLSTAVGMVCVAICQVAVHPAADYVRSIPLWILSAVRLPPWPCPP